MKNKNMALSQTAVKCRFFAQYWGQIIQNNGSILTFEIDEDIFPISNDDYETVNLKSVTNITDDDAFQIAMMQRNERGQISLIRHKKRAISNVKRYTLNNLYTVNSGIIDFLRFKGYAVPYLEYSVEDLISFGWVRLV
jgi:hypothetical protein